MEIMPMMAEAVVAVVMKPAKVMPITEMAARPVSGVEMLAYAADSRMADASRVRCHGHAT